MEKRPSRNIKEKINKQQAGKWVQREIEGKPRLSRRGAKTNEWRQERQQRKKDVRH